jgi:hypothetical protein
MLRRSPNSNAKASVGRDYTASACCYIENFLAGFLGLGRPTAFAVLAFCLEFLVVLGTAFCRLPPAFPPKTNGGGILLFRQSGRT